jgi:hypothetical protein
MCNRCGRLIFQEIPKISNFVREQGAMGKGATYFLFVGEYFSLTGSAASGQKDNFWNLL